MGTYWIAIYGGLQYLIVYGVITGPLTKRMEYRADAFAAERVGSSTCAAMLTHLDQLTGGMLTRGNFTHPTLRLRLRNIGQAVQASQTEPA